MNQKILEKMMLFRGIHSEELLALLACLQAKEQTVAKETFLFLAGKSEP